MRTTLRNTAKLAKAAAVVAASGGLLVTAPVAAHAGTNGIVHPAVTNTCSGGAAELHYANGRSICISGKGSPIINDCGFDWVNTGNNWVAFYWGAWLPATNYQPGMGPGSTWWGGSNFCIGQVDINT
jgi:hypothetical protein